MLLSFLILSNTRAKFNKIPAILLSLLITLLVFSSFSLINNLTPIFNREEVIISRVIDGDTLVLKDNRTIRLLNVNSPEKDNPLHENSEIFLKQFENKTVKMEIKGKDKYGRYLSRMYSSDYINLLLVKYGLSSIFMVENSEREKFKEAEIFAIENEQGIWSKSKYFGCIKSKFYPEKEIINLVKNCNFSLKNYYIKDESRKIYLIKKDFYLINLNSGKGEDNETDLFWGSSTPIWNNDADTFYLFDANDKIVAYGYYGYR